MSLNWDATRCLNLDSRTDDEFVALDCLIWGTMAVGMNEITKANCAEWYFRIRVVEGLFGAMRHKGDEEKYFTFPEIVRFIGLGTNATSWTRNQFFTHVWKRSQRDDEYRVKRIDKILEEVSSRPIVERDEKGEVVPPSLGIHADKEAAA